MAIHQRPIDTAEVLKQEDIRFGTVFDTGMTSRDGGIGEDKIIVGTPTNCQFYCPHINDLGFFVGM
jgi:hypothetical protein